MSDDDPSASTSAKIQLLLKESLQWIKDNPKETAVYIGSGLISLNPGLVTMPAFAALGLGAGGPIPGMKLCSYCSSLVHLKEELPVTNASFQQRQLLLS
jgi:hypothetical protein